MTIRLSSALITSALITLIFILTAPSRTAGELFKTSASFGPAAIRFAPAASPSPGVSRSSKSGEIASGSESGHVAGRQITLNIRPCKGADGEFVSFHWPFRRYVLGSVNCGGSQVAIVQVEQQ